MTQTARFSYVVRYRRQGWQQRKAAYYRDLAAAERLVGKLTSPTTHFEPVVECVVERQRLGPVEEVWTMR